MIEPDFWRFMIRDIVWVTLMTLTRLVFIIRSISSSPIMPR